MASVDGHIDKNFEARKADHVRLALETKSQADGLSGLARVRLVHEALPEINWSEVSLDASFFGEKIPSPIFVSSMTAGHKQSELLNSRIAEAAEARGWVMGIGSQRKQIFDDSAAKEWTQFRQRFPKLKVMGNIGLSQLIEIPNEDVKYLADSIQASAMIVHTNPLQEVIQPEGTPQFRGGIKRLEDLSRNLQLPIVLKETGCGVSKRTLLKLKGLGLRAVDVSGLGGTHWGRIEGERSGADSIRANASEVFKDWGNSTVDSMKWAQEAKADYEVWASGGVRSGLDAAKLFALGAKMVGVAQPVMQAAVESSQAVHNLLEKLEFDLRIALFCTGSRSVQELRNHIEVKDEPRT